MNPYIACLKSYVPAWWMKLLVVAIVVGCVIPLVLTDGSRRSWEPAWSRPGLVHWTKVNGISIQDGASIRRSANDSVPIDQIEGVIVDGEFDTRFNAVDAPLLRYYLLDLRLADFGYQLSQRETRLAAEALASIRDVPSIDTVELRGMLDPHALEPLRGSTTITRLITSDLNISGGEGRPEQEEQMASLIETVCSLPNLQVWGIPREWYLFHKVDPALMERLHEHESLTQFLVRPDADQPLHTSMSRYVAANFPEKTLVASHVNAVRFAAFWIILTVTMAIANLVITSLAGVLTVSSAPVLPHYSRTHRRTVAGLLGLIALASLCGMLKFNVALAPAVITALLGVALAGAMLDVDRRRAVPGWLVLPLSFGPMLAMILPMSLSQRGYQWLWLDEFLRQNAWTAATAGFLIVTAVLAYRFWRSVPLYAPTLSSNGRVNAIVANRGDTMKIFAKATNQKGSARYTGGASIIPSRALADDQIPLPNTPDGRKRWMRAGFFRVPPIKLAINITIMVVVYPLVLRLISPDLFANPAGLAIMGGALGIGALWAAPMILWNDRSTRIAQEIGTMMPRQLYVATMRSVIHRQMTLPTVLTLVGVSIATVVKTGNVLPIVGIALATAATHFIAVSAMELLFTLKSSFAKLVLGFTVCYAGLGAAFASFVVCFKFDGASDIPSAVQLLPFAISVAIAVGVRLWMNRRMPNFEFGRLV